MELSYEQIRKYTKGALAFEERDDGLRFYRCTKKQIDAWYAINEVLGQRAKCTTGLRVDFLTDATDVSFENCRHGKYELYVDGDFVRREVRSEEFTFSHRIKDEQDGKMHRVTFWLPSHSGGLFRGISLGGGEKTKSPEYGLKLLFLGDSITQGWNSALDTNSFALRMVRHYGADSVNQAVGGGFFAREILDKLDFDPDVVYTAFGTNDFIRFRGRPEVFREAMEGYFDYLSELFPDKPVVAISPIYRFFKNEADAEEFGVHCDVIIDSVKKHGFILADGFEMVPHDISLYDDGLHPIDSGFEIYAENLIKITDGILK